MRIRAAEPDDVEAIAAIVERAYGVYVERIGMRPGPMDDDYGEQVRRGLVHVAEDGGDGRRPDRPRRGRRAACRSRTSPSTPPARARGSAARLLEFAEQTARGAGVDTVALYTHEKMSENLALYAGLGYEEDERRPVTAFGREFARRRS